ncbi:unnamed protein product [Paramecium sonneborni]|uniref:Alpha-carbonic anhydrase domain-containing protein n=1 Tax=Paramecium sonneborni TaxID=65129 RepID=A0A8S1REM8_9CILI|nr:unnamed protein product [Paramecium sonneborni]
MASNLYQQNEINFNKKVEEFNQLYQQYSMTQSKQLKLEKMKLIHVQAEQQFKFMEIEYSSFNEQNKQEFAQKFRQSKILYIECQKKLRDLQQDIDKQPQSHHSNITKKTQPSQISGLNSDLHSQVKQLHQLDSRLLEAEDTQIIRRRNCQKLLKIFIDERNIEWSQNDLETCNHDQEQRIIQQRYIDDFGLHINNWKYTYYILQICSLKIHELNIIFMILSTIFILFYINEALATCLADQSNLTIRNLKPTQSQCDNTMMFNISFIDYPLTIDIVKQQHTIYTVAPISTLSASDIHNNLNAYTATSFEFRSPSQHQLDGTQYDFEMLIHHQLNQGFISDSQIAIVSILFKIDKKQSQPFFDDYYFKILKFQNITTLTINFHNSLGYQISSDPSFYTYIGTSDSHLLDCQQLVQWYVLDTPLPITQKQFEQFNYLFHNNQTKPENKTNQKTNETIDLLKLKGKYCDSHLARDFGLFLGYCVMIFMIYKSI